MPEAPLDPSHDWNADFRLEVYRRADGDWGWRPVSVHNGQVLTPEGYRNKGFLLDLLGRLFPQAAPPVEVEADSIPGMEQVREAERRAFEPFHLIGDSVTEEP